MYAQVSLIGRVTHDVELKTRNSTGEPYMKLSIAVNEGFGERTHTSYYQCFLDSNEALRAQKAKVSKGSLLFISGPLSIADYTRKDGTPTRIAQVSHARWDYVSNSKKSDGTPAAAPNAAPAPAAVPTAPPMAQVPNDVDTLDLDEGDLPF